MSLLQDQYALKTALEELPVAVWLVDRERQIIFWNHAAEKLSGHATDEVVGSCSRGDLLSDAGELRAAAGARACNVTETLRDGKVRDADVFLRHKSGRRVLVHVHTVPLRDRDGAIIGAAETVQETRDSGNSHAHAQRELLDHVDSLSGLPDRRSMMAHLHDAFKEFAETQASFSVLQMQPDHLERVQSAYGKGAVEAVMQVAARALTSILYPGDVAGCWEPHQFLAIIRECPKAALKKVGDRIRTMTDYAEIKWWGDPVPVTVSIGAAAIEEADSVESLLARAEGALRRSAESGGDRVTVVPEEQKSRAV